MLHIHTCYKSIRTSTAVHIAATTQKNELRVHPLWAQLLCIFFFYVSVSQSNWGLYLFVFQLRERGSYSLLFKMKARSDTGRKAPLFSYLCLRAKPQWCVSFHASFVSQHLVWIALVYVNVHVKARWQEQTHYKLSLTNI